MMQVGRCLAACLCGARVHVYFFRQVDQIATDAASLKKRKRVDNPFLYVDLEGYCPSWAAPVDDSAKNEGVDGDAAIGSLGHLGNLLSSATKARLTFRGFALLV